MSLWIAFTVGGAVSGLITAYALDMKSPKELAQGVVGGIIAGLAMAAMLPHR
ncbi:MAG: hypothetical protein P9M14_11125 [Candidatus Alcyoniella australis]|nr:hypothetical protein [Candidatus Alcyoniella australis]